ncbi:MAG: hypothetical protein ACLTR4_11780 [Gallintestinimicrobium sp.]
MAEYRKQIAYLDYLEDGVKIKNAGFVRIEEQNGHNRMEVKVKNLPGKDCGEFRLQEEHERTVGRISLQGGNGNCCMVWRMPEPGELDNSREESWQQTAQLRILLPGKRMLIANWHEPVEIPAQKETLQLQQQSQVQGDQFQQMEAAVIADKFTPAARSWRNYSVSGAARQRDGKAVHTEGACRNRAVRHIGGACRNRAIRHVEEAR